MYVLGAVWAIVPHFVSHYVLFYYEPSAYGTVAEDFMLYSTGGQADYFTYTHVVAIGSSLVLYAAVVAMLIKMKLVGASIVSV